MNFRHHRILLLLAVILAITSLAGCRPPRLPGPRPIIIDGGHPDRPRHRLRHYRYRYFPGSQVYYDSSRKIYFYLSNNVWLSVPVLPRHIHVDWDDYVSLELEGPKPHLHHKDVFKRYPPRHKKKAPVKKMKKRERRERQQEQKEYRQEKKERRKDYRDDDDERRYNKRERRKDYQGEQEERRYEKRQEQREYRQGREERRQDTRERRQGYRDDDDDDDDDNDRGGKRKKDRDDWRGPGRPVW